MELFFFSQKNYQKHLFYYYFSVYSYIGKILRAFSCLYIILSILILERVSVNKFYTI